MERHIAIIRLQTAVDALRRGAKSRSTRNLLDIIVESVQELGREKFRLFRVNADGSRTPVADTFGIRPFVSGDGLAGRVDGVDENEAGPQGPAPFLAERPGNAAAAEKKAPKVIKRGRRPAAPKPEAPQKGPGDAAAPTIPESPLKGLQSLLDKGAKPETPADPVAVKLSAAGLQSLLDRAGCVTVADALAKFADVLSPGEIATLLGVPRLSIVYALDGNLQDAVEGAFRKLFTIKGE